MTTRSSYEVQAYDGRHWMIQRRLEGQGARQECLAEAQAMEREGLVVRVVLERWDEDVGQITEEAVLYKTRGAPSGGGKVQASVGGSPPPRLLHQQPESGGGFESRLDAPDLVLSQPHQHHRAARGSGGKAMLILVQGLVLATIITVTVGVLLSFTDIPLLSDPTVVTGLLIAVFSLVGALTIARPLSRYLSQIDGRPKPARPQDMIVDPAPAPKKRKKKQKDQAEEKQPPAEEEKKPEEEQDKATEQAIQMLSRSLQMALLSAKRYDIAVDNFTRFGLCLLLAGQQDPRTDESSRKAYLEVLERLGVKQAHAEQMPDKLSHYSQSEKYRSMMERGAAIRQMWERGEDPETEIAAALSFWSRPSTADASGRWSLFFTDIVGSTAMTQQYGDAKAQEMIRAHNRIVRGALLRNFGKEVKHTGDGIMAAFPKAPDALRAACQIQETLARELHHTEPALHLRVGIATGVPLIEDQDFFGQVVQMAARLCDKAGSDGILVDQTTQEAAPEFQAQFQAREPQVFRGFPEPVPVALVRYGGAPAAAPAEQASA